MDRCSNSWYINPDQLICIKQYILNATWASWLLVTLRSLTIDTKTPLKTMFTSSWPKPPKVENTIYCTKYNLNLVWGACQRNQRFDLSSKPARPTAHLSICVMWWDHGWDLGPAGAKGCTEGCCNGRSPSEAPVNMRTVQREGPIQHQAGSFSAVVDRCICSTCSCTTGCCWNLLLHYFVMVTRLGDTLV